ncbi:hypothetical protein FB451DRAFT_1167908 [Mycena latifolia]|nr:hypothetical protein FB451DRAFT_1167908 [Mycena latifolia]
MAAEVHTISFKPIQNFATTDFSCENSEKLVLGLIGFITTALVMGGAVHAQLFPIPLNFIAYADDNGGGAQTTYNDVVTGVCYKTSATARSIKTEPVSLSAAFWRSGDCTHVVGDNDGGYSDLTYAQPVPLSFIAYADDNGGGAQTTYNNVITEVCYPSNTTVRSIKPESAPLFVCFYRSGDCTHAAGDGLNQQFSVPYDKVINTEKDVHSIKYSNELEACELI